MGSPLEVLKFRGDDWRGYPTEVHVARLGRWLYLRGKATPDTTPVTSSYFSHGWTLKGLARQTPFADFDDNDQVNGGDLSKWAAGFGATQQPATNSFALGDVDADGDVDGLDFLTWQQDAVEAPTFEFFDAAIDAAIASAATPAPEPAAGGLMALAFAGLALRRRAARAAAQ
jgi:hypothetical protein